MVIPTYNPSVDDLERSYLSQGISAGVTSVTIDNTNGFANTNRIMLGELGREKTEIVSVGAVVTAGTALTTTTTVFPHEAGGPVTVLRFDQIKYYRSTTGKTGTYSLLATVDIDVDNADLLTNYDDTTGVSTYYYKVSFYNSVTTLESSLSDPISGGGYDRSTVGFMINEILQEVSDLTETFVTRDEMIGWFNEVNDDLITRAKKPYDFLHTRVAASRVAQDASGSGTTLSFPSDMLKLDFVQYNYVDSTTTPVTNVTYPVRIIPLEEFRNTYSNTLFSATSTDNSDELRVMAIDTGVSKFRLWPPSATSSSNVFYIYYWKEFTQLDSEGDVFETPTPRIYKNYALHKFYLKKSAQDQTVSGLAATYLGNYNAEVSKLKRADNKDGGSPKGFRFNPQTYKGNRRF